jgi:recombination protein RecA
MPLARADLESLLRARKLDRTLTSVLPSLDPHDEFAVASLDRPDIDDALGGGFPRGQISELVGPRSSGRTSLMLQAFAAATEREENVALVDALDMFDPVSAAAAGVDLARLLWIRGHMVSEPGLCRERNQRALDQCLRAFALVLQARLFGLAVLDIAEATRDVVRSLPFTTWLRLQRLVEGEQTACLLVGTEQTARSPAGMSVILSGRSGSSRRFHGKLFEGLDSEIQIVSARARGRNGAGQPGCTLEVRTSVGSTHDSQLMTDRCQF